MSTSPAAPARPMQWEPGGVPRSTVYDDVYHPRAGAFAQADHVFLRGNGLPERWQGRTRFVILETGFGLGNNFLATWARWRQDAQRCERLFFISIEKHPLSADELREVHRDSPHAELARQLIEAWPPLTPDLHPLSFETNRVVLLLALGDVARWLPELSARVDAFYLDGFAPAKNPEMWRPPLFKAMARLAAPGATVASWTAARSVRDGLRSAGFVVTPAHGTGGKRDITLAHHHPHARSRHAPPPRMEPAQRHAVIIGAGLAGCAAAWALAQAGWRSTLIDRQDAPAQEASGNPGGLFHGIFHPQDGPHARLTRIAALSTHRLVREACARGSTAGSADGFLRLETSLPDEAAMQAQLDQLGLPASYVRALSVQQASALAGLNLAHPAWFYPGAGWVHPAGLAQDLLTRAGDLCTLQMGQTVERLKRSESDGDAVSWEVIDQHGVTVARAPVVVLANAGDAQRLAPALHASMHPVRGQISQLPITALPRAPGMALSGTGYALPPIDGHVVFGATAQAHDLDETVRDTDHRFNLSRLSQLYGEDLRDAAGQAWRGRTGWRWVTRDKLPLIGAVPDTGAEHTKGSLHQMWQVKRQPGLFVLSGLASRGITWAPLGAQVLAAQITGEPTPLGRSLQEAVDPARFLVRAARHSPRKPSTQAEGGEASDAPSSSP